ncbi:hypothetical protein Acsp04_18660 [Actinomadura sp. NBRC 104425]|uniref:hypothetical protein n=1 Tax=Actinomadura sp. NBRC 104425 TaxID=3032204 RepID=UPI0024A363E2|nr:hypothetical protein [Actinomadura sp. NBRC 104425]GLZ11631.1 hypothetical protein Acsp04_18660 [Actinomadura sp. NBRC 104425]
MRTYVKIDRDGELLRVELTKNQYDLVSSALIVFPSLVKSREGRLLMLGRGFDELQSAVADAGTTDLGWRVVICSIEGVHALHSLLVCLPLLYLTEESFVIRVKFFKEQLIGVASGLREGLKKIGDESNL